MILSTPFLRGQSPCGVGEAVTMQHFGTGQGGGVSMPGNVKGLTYTSGACPQNGEYTITSQSSGCPGNRLHNQNGDNTPEDINGRFLLFQTASGAGDFYVDTMALCVRTDYRFSFSLANMRPPFACSNEANQGTFRVRVESLSGQVLAEKLFDRLPLTIGPFWIQQTMDFSTRNAEGTVVVRFSFASTGPCGLALALDDLVFQPCGPVFIALFPRENVTGLQLCLTDQQTYQMTAPIPANISDPDIQWQVSTDSGQVWRNIPGATSSTYLRAPTVRGYFQYRMLVGERTNSNTPGCRYASTVASIWIGDVVPYIQANASRICAGTALQLFSFGGVKYSWTGPAGFQSTEQNPIIPAAQYANAGQYTVTIATDYGCTGSSSLTVNVVDSVISTISPGGGICEGASLPMEATGGIRYKWWPSDGLSSDSVANPIARPQKTTNYSVEIENATGCRDTAEVEVIVSLKPIAYAGADFQAIQGIPFLLSGASNTNDVRFRWSPAQDMDNPNIPGPSVTVRASQLPLLQTFILEVTSTKGCGSDTDAVLVGIYETVKAPNTFTPNGDGYNDVWEIPLLSNFPGAKMEIYNTSGRVVFQSRGYQTPWDGRRNGQELPTGTYYYIIDLNTNPSKRVAGYVTILR